MIPSIKSNSNHWTVIVDSQTYNFDASHPNYEGLVECVRTGDAEEFLELLNSGAKIENWSEGNFEFRDGILYYGDEQIARQPTERIINMIKNGWDHGPMLAYLDLLYQNVSHRAVMESYNWCSHKGLPITEDGYLLGYKGVAVYNGSETKDKMGREIKSGDLVDKYTGNSYRNNIGDVCRMNRRQVSDNCNEGCAAGLHVGTYEYANDWATSLGKVVLVKFSPADIVSVPTDCNFQKMRVSQYTVIGIARELIEEDVYIEDEEDYLDSWEDDEEYED